MKNAFFNVLLVTVTLNDEICVISGESDRSQQTMECVGVTQKYQFDCEE